MEYQIVFEGVIGKGRSGEIAIDDIRLSTDVPLENCMGPEQPAHLRCTHFLQGLLLQRRSPEVHADCVPSGPWTFPKPRREP
ncbi:hypothetical protein P7K49_013758 [Saguinus oedipus]|uniref:MAM domain-containing protein n=1 Tax=Saguinus oedipus TaxID=9490 RepID=A0ABQ9VIY9_SAGOE|nr:hypothetical protein P7K49_013758 [Saguinus oedipus]